MKNVEGLFAVRELKHGRRYWNTTAASWVDDFEDRSEFTTRAAAEEVAVEHFGEIEDRSWVLLGHNMFIGKTTLYYRGTRKGVGGSLSIEKATHFTREGAKLNQIPPFDPAKGRGWELLHVVGAPEFAEVDDHYVDGDGVTRTRKLIVKLDD